MGDRPVLHLTNWSSRKLHARNVYTIMRRPRAWEHGAGRVEVLTPDAELFADFKARRVDWPEYQRRFNLGVEVAILAGGLAPGRLVRDSYYGHPAVPVADGDTLCCACARDAPCHRALCVPFLVRAGWRVVLDGRDVE